MTNFNKIVLENGLRIITAPKLDSLATTVLVLVEAGSKYETKEINGLSHFLEHMCFKGTEKRPRSIDIASELDAVGAVSNAFTSQEYTGYFAKAEPKYFDSILDIVSDIYLHPVFETKEIDKERGVIIEEINMYEDLPMRRVHELFSTLLYGDQPAGWDIAGRKEVIQKLNRDDFIKYQQNHYLANSTLVVVAGNFDEKEAIEKIKNSFSSIKISEKTQKIATKEHQEKPEIVLKQKDSDQTHLVLGVRVYDIFDKRKYALEVLGEILGGGMSSRLFQKIREEMGAAYYVGADSDLYTDHGYLAASAGIDHNKIESVLEAILEEFHKIAREPVEKKELQRVKDRIIGHLFLSLETSNQLANFFGGQEILTRQIISPDEISKKIQAVTAEEITAVAADIFKNNRLNLAIIGPFEDKTQFENIFKL
ncbi:MAG: pitrilysin family protein [Patescibacteria group bacterium]